MGTLTAPGIGQKKLAARAAMVGVDAGAGKLLEEWFREFQIEVVAVDGGSVGRLSTERFEALVIRLQPETQSLMEQARNSRSNKRVVIYGIAKDTQDAMRYSRFGINALFEAQWLQDPPNRQAVLKVLRATHLLVAQEMRRYVRLPLVTEVSAQAAAPRLPPSTQVIRARRSFHAAAPQRLCGR